MVVTHRIVEKSEEGYCTKGDANAEEDAGIVLEKTGDRECDRSSSLAWLWYRLAPAERNTRFFWPWER